MDLVNTMIFHLITLSLCLGTEMVEISRVEGKVISLNCREKMARPGNPNPKRGIYRFPTGLKRLKPPWAWVT